MRAHHDERLAQAISGLAPAIGGFPAGPCRTREARRLTACVWAARVSRLMACALLVFTFACTELTAPPAGRSSASDAPAASAPSAPVPPPDTLAVADRTPPPAPAAGEQIEASHILVSYQGATRAKPTVTRTRDEARTLAEKLVLQAREPGADFARLAKDVSDGPSGVEGGALPRFGRQQMVKPFSDAAFALRPGEISGVVETNFGFHIIKRIQ